MERMRGKTETNWVIEIGKEWTEMGIWVDNNREGYKNRIEKHQWGN